MVASEVAERPTSMAGCLVRLVWMFLGSGTLFLVACFIAFSTSKIDAFTFSALDLVFWSGVVITAVLRYVDVRFLEGRTVGGAPATRGVLVRFVILLVIVAAAGWLAAHGVRYLLQ